MFRPYGSLNIHPTPASHRLPRGAPGNRLCIGMGSATGPRIDDVSALDAVYSGVAP